MILVAGFAIDASVTEDHTARNEVTDNPVESGAVMTDHVRRMPATLTLECIVSDSPLGQVEALRGEGTVPSVDARAHLESLLANPEPFTVVTSIRTYENMVIESLSEPRRAGIGHAMRFTATLRQITIVTNERTTVQVAVPRAAKKVNRGHRAAKKAPTQAPLPPPKAVENQSIAAGYVKGDTYTTRHLEALRKEVP